MRCVLLFVGCCFLFADFRVLLFVVVVCCMPCGVCVLFVVVVVVDCWLLLLFVV